MLALRAAPPPRPSLTLPMTRPSSALRAPSPGGRRISMTQHRADTSAEIPLPPGEGGRRPGEGRVINPSAAPGAVIPLGVTWSFMAGVLVGIAFADRFSEIVFLL